MTKGQGKVHVYSHMLDARIRTYISVLIKCIDIWAYPYMKFERKWDMRHGLMEP